MMSYRKKQGENVNHTKVVCWLHKVEQKKATKIVHSLLVLAEENNQRELISYAPRNYLLLSNLT